MTSAFIVDTDILTGGNNQFYVSGLL